jgi:hypothetical protein
MVGCLTGDTSGVISKGVGVCEFPRCSKLDKLDSGLVSGDAVGAVSGSDVWLSGMYEFWVGFGMKRPELSL